MFSNIVNPYLFWLKVAGGVLGLLLLVWAWNSFTGHYVDKGYQEAKALCVKENAERLLAEADIEADRRADVLAKESLAEVEANALVNKLIEENRYEKNAKDSAIAELRSGTRRMREYPGTTKETQASSDVPYSSADSPRTATACTARLPVAVGETALGIGADANEVGRKLLTCVELLKLDRKVCNGL